MGLAVTKPCLFSAPFIVPACAPWNFLLFFPIYCSDFVVFAPFAVKKTVRGAPLPAFIASHHADLLRGPPRFSQTGFQLIRSFNADSVLHLTLN